MTAPPPDSEPTPTHRAPATERRTSTLPLALSYAALLVYASLYPFSDWRDQGVLPWAWLHAPLPRYWTWFDVVANVLGYAPLGALLVLALLRTGRVARTGLLACAVATLALCGLSFALESVQTYLLRRYPSNLDWGLNTMGAAAGALSAWALERAGWLERWEAFRAHWLVPDARGALVLIALWPFALLFPASVPLGLGHVLERLELWAAEVLADTPWLEWLPLREIELQPLLPVAEIACVACALLAPCLLGFSVVRERLQRLIACAWLCALALLATTLSAALTYGPEESLAWASATVMTGLISGAAAAVLLHTLPRPWCLLGALVVWALGLALLNDASEGPYFAQTLQTWEQGRFVRFNGLAQWLGWLWPYVAMLYCAERLLQGKFKK